MKHAAIRSILPINQSLLCLNHRDYEMFMWRTMAVACGSRIIKAFSKLTPPMEEFECGGNYGQTLLLANFVQLFAENVLQDI